MSRDDPGVTYNKELRELEAALRGVERSGDFFAMGTKEIAMPRIEVEGAGTLSFPLPATQAKELVRVASKAPYGRGKDTVYDEEVRKTWQIEPEKISIRGASWEQFFEEMLGAVCSGMGCVRQEIDAELYKLLLYDKGAFFKAHRDTEKGEGMFGTLVLSLPSLHEGGTLLIRHKGREVRVDLSCGEVSEIRFAAFYADCEHEVLPVKKGYRLCLIYNLIQKCQAKGIKRLCAPEYEDQAEAAASVLKKGLATDALTKKVAWLLEHNYTPASLSFKALKGTDKAVAKVLLQAAEKADCVAHLGMVHIEEYGYPNYDSYYSGYEDYEDNDEAEMEEVTDWNYHIDEWRNAKDEATAYGDIPLGDNELLPPGALDGATPDEQSVTEATGNAGAEMERFYYRAAVVLWHRTRHGDVLLQAGATTALPFFEELVRKNSVQAQAIADKILDKWGAHSYRYDKYDEIIFRSVSTRSKINAENAQSNLRFLTSLNRLENPRLLELFFEKVVDSEYDKTLNKELTQSAFLLDPKKTEDLFVKLMKKNFADFPRELLDLLVALERDFTGENNMVMQIANEAIQQLQFIPPKKVGVPWELRSESQKKLSIDSAFARDLFQLLDKLGNETLIEHALEIVIEKTFHFEPQAILAPALKNMGGVSVFDKLWAHAASFLLNRSEHEPQKPKDWEMNGRLSCNCADCAVINQFLKNPNEEVLRFPIRKDRRQHLHQEIDQHRLALTHQTERKGSPQILVCTKTLRDYENRLVQYRLDCKAMQALSKLNNPDPNLEKRLAKMKQKA